jgi:hypothetical protein
MRAARKQDAFSVHVMLFLVVSGLAHNSRTTAADATFNATAAAAIETAVTATSHTVTTTATSDTTTTTPSMWCGGLFAR